MGLQYKLIILAVLLLVISGLAVTVHLYRGKVSLLESRNTDLIAQVESCVDVSTFNLSNIEDLRQSYDLNIQSLKDQLRDCLDSSSLSLSDCASSLNSCRSQLRLCVNSFSGEVWVDNNSDVILSKLNNIFKSFE